MRNENGEVVAEMQIPIQGDNLKIGVVAGYPVFILGRNGTGKSALVNFFATECKDNALYVLGSRPCYFEKEKLSMAPASREHFRRISGVKDYSPDGRWNSSHGPMRNEKTIYDIQVAQRKFVNARYEQFKSAKDCSTEIEKNQSNSAPFDIINSLLLQANLRVHLKFDGEDLVVEQGDSSYSYAEMSDGERCALLIASEVIAAKEGTVFVLDEPEVHLHPSIVVSLVKALTLQRPDCGFVISTHQLELPAVFENGKIVLVRDSVWDAGKVVSWDVEVISDSKKIPEWLLVDLLGARRKILFIEGNAKTSLDQRLYACLFPDVSVRPIESCVNVVKAVDGLRGVWDIHRAEVYGLIDNDGRSEDELSKYEERGVYPLSVFAVESLVYAPEVLSAVATERAKSTNKSACDMLRIARETAVASLKRPGTKEHLAVRLAERTIRDKLLEQIPTRGQIKEKSNGVVKVAIESPYLDELKRLTELVNKCEIDEVVSRYPVRESGVLDYLAKGLEYKTRGEYEEFALLHIARDAELQGVLRHKLGKLAEKLEGQRHCIDAQKAVLQDECPELKRSV